MQSEVMAYFILKDVCSHKRSYLYYARSVYLRFETDAFFFPAVRCFKNLLNQLECKSNIAYMGYDANINTPEGDYYLLTKYEEAYSYYGNYTDWNLGTNGSDPFFNKTVLMPQASFSFL